MTPYYVVSEEYTTYGGDHLDPPEYGRDCVTVLAETKRQAVLIGVKKILKEKRRSYAADNRRDGMNPFVGYHAERALCRHGNPLFWVVDGDDVPLRCWACEAAFDDRFGSEETNARQGIK